MEKCYFNSCPLNDANILKRFKKRNPKLKKLFCLQKLEDDLMKMSNVGVYAKNIICCLDHIERYKSFKIVKRFLLSEEKSNQAEIERSKIYSLIKDLEILNNLTRYDSEIRKLFLNLKHEKEENFILKTTSQFKTESSYILSYIFSLFNKFDTKTDVLILQNFSNFVKDINTIASKKNNIEEYFLNVLQHFLKCISINFENENFNSLKENKFDCDFTYIATNSLNILSTILSHSDSVAGSISEKNLNENLEKLFDNLFDITILIINSCDLNCNSKNAKCENLIFSSILNFVNSFYTSSNIKDNVIYSKINNFFVRNSTDMFKYFRNFSTTIDFEFLTVFYSSLLFNFSESKIENLPEGLECFLKSFEEFFTLVNQREKELMNFYFFINKCKDLVKTVKDRLNFSSSLNAELVQANI